MDNNLEMRVIGKKALRDYWERCPDAEGWLRSWYRIARASRWRSLTQVRAAFPHADPVRVRSGSTVTVFNVCGNKHRLVAAIHYDSQRVFVLAVMTHGEYSRGRWKENL